MSPKILLLGKIRRRIKIWTLLNCDLIHILKLFLSIYEFQIFNFDIEWKNERNFSVIFFIFFSDNNTDRANKFFDIKIVFCCNQYFFILRPTFTFLITMLRIFRYKFQSEGNIWKCSAIDLLYSFRVHKYKICTIYKRVTVFWKIIGNYFS